MRKMFMFFLLGVLLCFGFEVNSQENNLNDTDDLKNMFALDENVTVFLEDYNGNEIAKRINEPMLMALINKVKNTNYTINQIEVLCIQLEEQGFSEEDINRIPELNMNDEGLTYGSDHLGADLISVKSDDGISGYVYRKELDEAIEASSIDEALTNPSVVAIKVYKEDGKEEIGTFTLSDGKESQKGGNEE